MKPQAIPACLLALLLAFTRVAHADAEPVRDPLAEPEPRDPSARPLSADDPAVGEAREAFRLGAELARAARWDEARLAFKRSSELKSHPTTTYNIGYCNRAVGRPAGALQFFQRALTEHEAGTSGRLPESLVLVVKQYLAEASARVARVNLDAVPDATLLVDGHPLEPFRSGTETWYVLAEAGRAGPNPTRATNAVLLLDPGTHVFIANRPGYAALVETRVLSAGERTELHFSFRPLPKVRQAKPTPSPQPAKPFDKRLYYASFGVGGLGLLVGAAAGIEALRRKSNLESACSPAGDCPRSSEPDIAALHRATTLSTVATALGAVGIATGVTLLLISPKQTASQAPALALSLAANGLSLHGVIP